MNAILKCRSCPQQDDDGTAVPPNVCSRPQAVQCTPLPHVVGSRPLAHCKLVAATDIYRGGATHVSSQQQNIGRGACCVVPSKWKSRLHGAQLAAGN